MTAPMTPQAYLDKIRPLRTEEEIEAVCNQLTWELFGDRVYKNKTKANALGAYNKVINTITNEELIEGKNAFIYTKVDGALWKRHLHFLYTGLTSEEWREINTSTNVLDRLENRREVPVTKYLETTIKLLQSEDPHELAVGLIAASGRRPLEILARGSFTLANELPDYLKPGYFVNFKGQAKKRDYDTPEDERAEYRIGVLVPAQFFLDSFAKFRKMPECKDLQDLIITGNDEQKSPEQINDEIESKRGNSLRRIARSEFSFIPARCGDSVIDNKSLRAVYVKLITARDCPKYIADLLWASRAVGHFIDDEKPDDSQLAHLLTTLGYSDYYTDMDVPFTEIPKKPRKNQAKETYVTARVYPSSMKTIKVLQKKWNVSSQQAVIEKLIERSNELEMLERRLMHAENEINKLNEEKLMLEEQLTVQAVEPQSENTDLQSMIRQIVAEEIRKSLPTSGNESVPTAEPTVEIKPTTKPKADPKPERNWEGVTNTELKNSKARGATEEKIFRAFQAIKNHNDNIANSNEQRWYIGSVTLRVLSGCNPQLVNEWIANHQTSVDDSNAKYDIGQYHNKRHKNMQITDVIKLWD